jgi:hypothetical protein
MSVEKISLVLNHSRAQGTEKLVLIGIANHDGDGGAWPSIETLARYANVSERSVQRALAKLVDLGEIEVMLQAGGNQQTRADQRPNLYRILVSPNGVTSASPREGNGVTSVTQRGDIHDANGVTPTSPEPSLEPSIEPPIDIDHHRFATAHFNTFWNIYPRKVGKVAALAAFRKACQQVDPLVIHAAAARFRDDPNRLDEFTPHPTTWLNQGRWDDDPLPARAGSGTRAYVEAAEALSGVNPYLELGSAHEPF